MEYWDEVLYPEVVAAIRGERYLIMSDKQIADELLSLTKRAINTFKFPDIDLSYDFETTTSEIYPSRYYFKNAVTDDEFNVLIAWVKYYWADYMVSNSDNFQNIYFDKNINSYSPGNVLHNYVAAKTQYLEEARTLEANYYRKHSSSNIGGTIDDQ